MLIYGISSAILLIIFIAYYNSFVSKRNDVKNAFASIDVQLKKRFDLIPNLAAAVKAYANHEYGTITDLTRLRSAAMRPNAGIADKLACNNAFSEFYRNFIVNAEAYPQLRASENFIHLQRTMNETEAQISASRRAYNAAVTTYNNAIQMFPNNVFAVLYRFSKEPLFEIPDSERQNVDVKRIFNV